MADEEQVHPGALVHINHDRSKDGDPAKCTLQAFEKFWKPQGYYLVDAETGEKVTGKKAAVAAAGSESSG